MSHHNFRQPESARKKLAVVIPCYKVRKHIIGLLAKMPPYVDAIYVIDDSCPQGTGDHVKESCKDTRVRVIHNTINKGVGYTVIRGYRAAVLDGAQVIVKIDGDGQMDPGLISKFVAPILRCEADYTKGNRFYNMEELWVMPRIRLFGNAVLSFLTKMSSGYWNVFDPTNGFTAIDSSVLRAIPLDKISDGYFFETDMLFRLNVLRAVVVDIPMKPVYGDEESNLNIGKSVGLFLVGHFRNVCKRILYVYYLRDMSIASLELPVGIVMWLFGVSYGAFKWLLSLDTGVPATPGSVMISALSVIIGLQLILGFLAYDMSNVPKRPVQGIGLE